MSFDQKRCGNSKFSTTTSQAVVKCHVCPSLGTKRCLRCRVTHYCSVECQTADWSDHKKKCSQIRKSHKRLAIEVNASPSGSELFKIYNNLAKKNGDMVLKIQVPMESPAIDPNGLLYAYDKDRSFRCFLDKKKLDAEEVIHLISAKGMLGVKGYFSAFMEEGKQELCLITDSFNANLGW